MSIKTRLLGSLLRFITVSLVLLPFLFFLFKPAWVLGTFLGTMLSFSALIVVLIFFVFSFSKASLSECQRILGCFFSPMPFGLLMGGFYSDNLKLINQGIFLLCVAFSVLMFKGLKSGKGFNDTCFKWLGKLIDIVCFAGFTVLAGLEGLEGLGCITAHWSSYIPGVLAIFLGSFAFLFIGGGLECQESQIFYGDNQNDSYNIHNEYDENEVNEVCCYIPAWSLGSEFCLNMEMAIAFFRSEENEQAGLNTQNSAC